MRDFTENDVQRGIGMFDQAMRAQSTITGVSTKISAGLAIGIVSAAMRSGLPDKHIEPMIEREFSADRARIKRVLEMYRGSDWDLTLWDRLETGKYKLCTDLCQRDPANWRYDPSYSF